MLKLATLFFICSLAICDASSNVTNQLITIEQQVDGYFKNLRFLKSKFKQSSNKEPLVQGTIWISKAGKKPQAKVVYESGNIERLLLNGRYLHVKYKDKNKIHTYSILTTPIYSILTGQLSLSDYKYTVCEDTKKSLSLYVELPNKQLMILDFSKDPINNKVKFLKSWTIRNSNSCIVVELDIKTLFINDETKVPSSVFN